MADPHAVVVGGGIAGLAAALALHRVGWAVTVCERAPVLEFADHAVALAPNALRALDTLDVGEDVRKRSAHQGIAALRRQDGRWLLRTTPEQARRRHGDPVCVLRRAELCGVLLERLPAAAVRTGTTATAVEPGDTRRPARVVTDAADHTADLVVLADGARSRLRAELFLEHPGAVYAGFAWLSAVVPSPGPGLPFAETWGQGGIAGVLPLTGDEVYCYATANAPAGERAEDERGALLARLADWHAPLPALAAAARPEAVRRTDVWHVDTPLPAYHKGRVALVGDTAHAMTPNLGQGAAQALEDAVVLAHHISGSMAYVPTALQSYTDARLPRTSALVQRSAQLAEAVQSDSPLAARVRDTAAGALGLVAPRLLARYTRPADDWRPPAEG
ncbi:FAD-dependent monooxygenase [Streptomonospora nanhaiensis]|uniref:2-polyprenyl-6-methoxyphenol hydroxylase-like FAD-dependent oxidoreductase n=1 Tax=Streptomonospora nanhaiensis TaxID=1323731 RepID=A0A853BRS8_9ACTN|nr:FAD-dependent monooxygenase [Streptomonospora nanhaiensis]MBV2362802.1 FAD-dependent monooxygenase [Streptomonospora nanhaiensis]MBX9386971.1 FAD-dependent monooxygenase [Streptomonospora nanhaiensis]NYI97843.1 2-polyprenyl-6-methoxyphenol hydroxylase-like FAD-dependent oxidoreductase [Streptomonospora nanhaiensis]